jgi:hypothetical protein
MGISGGIKKSYIEERKVGPDSIPRWVNKIIDEQLEKNICKIYIDKSIFGTGFLCKIPYPNEFKKLPVLITNNHIINEEYFLKNKEIKISFDDDKINKKLLITQERKFYTSKEYDVSIIEIFPNKDNIHHFLEFNQDEEIEKKEKYKNLSIYIIHYPNKSCISYGIINNIQSFEIEHKCSTEKGSSGSPIILLNTFKVIGVHKGCGKDKEDFNFGTLLRYPILEFNGKKEKKNEIIIKLKIEDNDINKDVYILNNPYYINSEGIKGEYDGLKEMNKKNTLMFINNEKVEYEKNKKFRKKGIYEIKLILKIN